MNPSASYSTTPLSTKKQQKNEYNFYLLILDDENVNFVIQGLLFLFVFSKLSGFALFINSYDLLANCKLD